MCFPNRAPFTAIVGWWAFDMARRAVKIWLKHHTTSPFS
jgi:hypothetical protein